MANLLASGQSRCARSTTACVVVDTAPSSVEMMTASRGLTTRVMIGTERRAKPNPERDWAVDATQTETATQINSNPVNSPSRNTSTPSDPRNHVALSKTATQSSTADRVDA